jgi:hypothetical protein
MSYTQLPDESPRDNSIEEKEGLTIRSQPDLLCFFSYKNLFGAALALVIATSVILAWVLAQQPAGYGNHVVMLVPFTTGMDHRHDGVGYVLTEMSSYISRSVTFNPD